MESICAGGILKCNQIIYLADNTVLHFTQVSYFERQHLWGLFCTTIQRHTLLQLVKHFGLNCKLIF